MVGADKTNPTATPHVVEKARNKICISLPQVRKISLPQDLSLPHGMMLTPEDDADLRRLRNQGRDVITAAKDLFEGAALNDNYVSNSTICEIIKQGDIEKLEEVLPLINVSHYVQDSTPPLHLAVREDQGEIVALLLDRGSNVNQRDGDGRSPLHIACSNGLISRGRQLLETGRCEVNTADNFGQYPLHNGVDNEDMKVVELLLEHKW
eukprot:sb/3470344/